MAYSYRRALPRFPLESSAEINTGKAKGIISMLTDVSAGGAGVVTNISFEVLEIVEIFIKASFMYKNGLKKKARVAWCNKLSSDLWKVGLDFRVDDQQKFS